MAYNILAMAIGLLLTIRGDSFPVFRFGGHSVVDALSRGPLHDTKEKHHSDYLLEQD